MSVWQSCLATVSVPPERGRELSAVSTEQEDSYWFLLVYYFCFSQRRGKASGFVCVREWASPQSGAHVFICRCAVCMLPIDLWLGKCEHTQHVCTVSSTLLLFKVDSWPTNTTIYPLLTLLTNWMETGRWRKTCLCASVCCVCFGVNQCVCVY